MVNNIKQIEFENEIELILKNMFKNSCCNNSKTIYFLKFLKIFNKNMKFLKEQLESNTKIDKTKELEIYNEFLISIIDYMLNIFQNEKLSQDIWYLKWEIELFFIDITLERANDNLKEVVLSTKKIKKLLF